MLLEEIKIKAILKNITMSTLAKLIGVDRRTMYQKIKNQDLELITKLENFFSN